MSDEEIEKALKFCIDEQNCYDCPYNVYRAPIFEDEQCYDQVKDCKDFQATSIDLLKDALDYIERLKNDIKCEQNRVYNTAKDILQDWYNDVKGMGEDGYYVKLIAEQYGVTIDE